MSSPPNTLDTGPYDTRTAGSASSSDFLLLTTDQTPLLSTPSTSNSIPLPPPRFRPILQVAAVLDLLFVLGYGATVPLKSLPLSAVGLNSLRSLVVLSAVSSVRVREYAPVLLGQLIVSALVLLYRLNELVQTSSSLATPSTISLPPIFSSHRLFNPISIWYLGSFGFSLLHYILYILFVGIRNRRNPFVGNGESGAMRRQSSRRRRRSTWTEQRWEGRQEWVRGGPASSVRSNSFRSEVQGGETEQIEEQEEEEGFDERNEQEEEGFFSNEEERSEDSFSDSTDSEEDDEDELIDIPKPGHSLATLRNRTSRASLLSLPSPTVSRDNALKASRNYGSMRSLSGI
ncbi:hypothetical protein JCM3765_005431 [Sporobolomyces pararoseus]